MINLYEIQHPNSIYLPNGSCVLVDDDSGIIAYMFDWDRAVGLAHYLNVRRGFRITDENAPFYILDYDEDHYDGFADSINNLVEMFDEKVIGYAIEEPFKRALQKPREDG